MRTTIILTLALLTTTTLSQFVVFKSQKCDPKSLNIAYLDKSNIKKEITLLENSIEVPKDHPCSFSSATSGSCCDLESSANLINKLPDRIVKIAEVYSNSVVSVFETVYFPFIKLVGPQKLREKAQQYPRFAYLAAFADLIPISQITALTAQWTRDFNDYNNLLLDLSSEAICRLCNPGQDFLKHTVAEQDKLTFGINSSIYQSATRLLVKTQAVSGLFDILLQGAKYFNVDDDVTLSEARQRIETILAAQKSDEKDEKLLKVRNIRFRLPLFTDSFEEQPKVYSNLSFFSGFIRAATSETKVSKRMLQGIIPKVFIPEVKYQANGINGLQGKNLTKQEKIFVSKGLF